VAADFRSRSRSNLMDADRPTRPGPEDPAAVDTWSWLLDCRQTGFFQRKIAFKAIAIEEDNLHVSIAVLVIKSWVDLSVRLYNLRGLCRWLCPGWQRFLVSIDG